MFGKWLFALVAPLALAVTLSACNDGVQPGIQAAPAGGFRGEAGRVRHGPADVTGRTHALRAHQSCEKNADKQNFGEIERPHRSSYPKRGHCQGSYCIGRATMTFVLHMNESSFNVLLVHSCIFLYVHVVAS